MSLKSFIFLFSTLALFFVLHWFVYFSIVRFFNITIRYFRGTIVFLLGLFTGSFFASAILVRAGDLWPYKTYYFVSAFWLGLLLYLVLAAAIAWFVVLIFKILGVDVKLIVGSVLFFAAFVYAFFGYFNALNPVVKELEVSIKALPETWQGKKVVHLTDVHLGSIHGDAFAKKMVSQVNALKPAAVFITGDLFDGMGSDYELFIEEIEKIETEYGIYFVAGNHEIYLGEGKVLEALENSKIHVLDKEFVNIGGLQVVGIGFNEFGNSGGTNNVILEMPGYNINKPSILLYHTPTGLALEPHNGDRPWQAYLGHNLDFKVQKEAGVDLQLSGHTHKGQMFPYDMITSRIYDGYDYGFHEIGEFKIYISNGVGTWGPPMRTNNNPEIVLITLK